MNTAHRGRLRSISALSILATVLAVVALASGHAAAQTVPPQADIAGTYTLVTIDGKPLPTSPSHEGGGPEVRSGSLTLAADMTFTGSMTYGLPDGRTMSRDFSGTYTRNGNRLTLAWKGAGTTEATVSGNDLTMLNEEIPFVYRKKS